MVKTSYSYNAHVEDVTDTQTVEPEFGDPKPLEETPVNAYIIDDPKSQAAPGKLGHTATIAVGGAIALVGIPMLILPGPGLLAIGGGVALMAKGAKGLFGNSQ